MIFRRGWFVLNETNKLDAGQVLGNCQSPRSWRVRRGKSWVCQEARALEGELIFSLKESIRSRTWATMRRSWMGS